MINFEKITQLDGVAQRIRFVLTVEQMDEICAKTKLSRQTVRNACYLTGAHRSVTRIALMLAKSNNPITFC